MIDKKFFLVLFLIAGSMTLGDHAECFYADGASQEKEKPEVISLLGKELYARPAVGEALRKLQEALEDTSLKLEADPEDAENLIQYGRSLAALWRYQEAIEVYSKGVGLHHDHALLYRHRGHRFISVRQFKKAVADLTRASELDKKNFDIWYHLGLAHYLMGEFGKARIAYESCMETAGDDDAKIAVSNWLYITLRRLDEAEAAGKVLEKIKEGMNVEENQSYYDLLLFYKGIKTIEEIADKARSSDLDLATIGYGIGCWHLYNNDEANARSIFEEIIQTPYWPAFGYIAAESELFRMKQE